jgi:farnesyl-diphosphate farnesyltransferase
MQLANSMGLFLQKTNITRDYLEDLVDNRSFYPADVWSLYHKSLPDLRHGDDKAIQCVNHIITDTLEHSQDCLSYLDQLHDKDVFRFCAIPQIMAIATLSECYNNRKIFTGVLKIRKGLAARIIQDCDNMKSVKKWFAKFASKIMNSVERDDPNAKRTIEYCLDLGAKNYGKNFMPKLTDTMEVAELGTLFVVIIYLLGFSGVIVAANLLNSNNDATSSFGRSNALKNKKKKL